MAEIPFKIPKSFVFDYAVLIFAITDPDHVVKVLRKKLTNKKL